MNGGELAAGLQFDDAGAGCAGAGSHRVRSPGLPRSRGGMRGRVGAAPGEGHADVPRRGHHRFLPHPTMPAVLPRSCAHDPCRYYPPPEKYCLCRACGGVRAARFNGPEPALSFWRGSILDSRFPW